MAGVAAALMAASAGVWAADKPSISADIEWFAYTMAALDLEQRKAEGDLLFADGAEPVPRVNPCADRSEPSDLCPCPPTPPWVPYCI